MTVRFTDIPFGPFQVRPLLRATLRDDERVIGWAPAHDQSSVAVNLLDAACMLAPGVGQAVITMRRGMRGVKSYLLVVTDRRLLVLAATRSRTAGTATLEVDVPLAELHVRCAGANDSPNALIRFLRRRPPPEPGQEYATRFSLRARSGWSVDLDVPQTSGNPSERLREALVTLAMDTFAAEQAERVRKV